MEAGKLNRKITVQAKTVIPDADLYRTEAWVTVASPWAEIIMSGGREFYAAQKVNAETSAVFKIRYTTRYNTKMRILYGNRVFEILGIIDPDGHKTDLLISAKEVI